MKAKNAKKTERQSDVGAYGIRPAAEWRSAR